MKSISILGLLGLSHAAVGPLPKTATFPKFDTIKAPTTEVDAAGFVLVNYLKNNANHISGPIVAYRNDLYVFPTQTLTAVASGDQTVTTAASGTRAFYPLSSTAIGTYPITTSGNTNAAAGATWAVCKNDKVATNAECNGGVGRKTGADNVVAKRIVARPG